MRTKIKICGITRAKDAELAVSLGVWAVGLNFWSGSPRAIDLDRGAELGALLKRRAEVVGVFVNPTLEEISAAAEVAGLTMVQLHGDEGPAFCGEVARRTGCKVIKSARVRSRADIQALSIFHTDFHLLDSYVPGTPGGSGETFAWELVSYRPHSAPPLILSGGLNAANVVEAIRAVDPYAVDIASGIESAPGRKDETLMREFFAAVHTTYPVVLEAEADAETGPEANVGTQAEMGTDTAAWTQAQAGAEADAGMQAQAEAEAEADAGTQAEPTAAPGDRECSQG